MAQEVYISGATYSAVPGIRLPDSNGDYHQFSDASVTTAVESDVAQGKIFLLADGTLGTGTSSGGGGGGGSTRTTIVPEQTVTVSGSYTSLTYNYELVIGEEYIYTINGTEYIGTAVDMYGTPTIGGYATGYIQYDRTMYFIIAGTELPTGIYTVKVEQESESGSEPAGASMNTQVAQSTTRRNNTSLGSITSLTCEVAGTYDVYWSCARSNTSQTWGSQLYINGTAYGSENTSWSNNVQNNHLTGVTIPANATVAVYGRSQSGYYIYAPQLIIEQKE